MSLRCFKLVISYDGTNYVGWQNQPNGPSIQQKLTDAVAQVTGKPVQPVGAGRTDSGVHAVAQVAHLKVESNLSCEVLRRALNANLPFDIRVQNVTEAATDFDAVRHATGKLYRYIFHDGRQGDVFARNYAWLVHYPLDIQLMREAALPVVGTHDFKAFESEWPNRKSSVRTVRRCDPVRFGDFVYLDVEADGFLYNMVRAIAGTLYEIGRGKWPVERMKQAIEAGDRTVAGPTAPARGLFLIRVDYD